MFYDTELLSRNWECDTFTHIDFHSADHIDWRKCFKNREGWIRTTDFIRVFVVTYNTVMALIKHALAIEPPPTRRSSPENVKLSGDYGRLDEERRNRTPDLFACGTNTLPNEIPPREISGLYS